MSAGESLQAEKIVDETSDDGTPVIAEVHEDDAWIAACRTGVARDDTEAQADTAEAETDLEDDVVHEGNALESQEQSEALTKQVEEDDASVAGTESSDETDVVQALDADTELDELNTSEATDPDPTTATDEQGARADHDRDDIESEATGEIDAADASVAESTSPQTEDMAEDDAGTASSESSEPVSADPAITSGDDTDLADTTSMKATPPMAEAELESQPSDQQQDAPATEETDNAMSEFGDSMGTLAAQTDDLDALDDFESSVGLYDSPDNSSSDEADSSVAPYIAQAERELEKTRSRSSHDIFDRIAMAAESQFDNARGSAMQRVTELVDDRRVGTKRWTPSKTMKQRMAKLEAARSAVESGETFETRKKRRETGQSVTADEMANAVDAGPVDTDSVDTGAGSSDAVDTATAASAAALGTAAVAAVAAAATQKPKAETAPAEDATRQSIDENERVKISRRDRQAEAREQDESVEADDVSDFDEDEEDVDGLRIVPGARGRRRDRARRSRLDEDFEKIFDEEDKPSIRGLRRKLRSGAAGKVGDAEPSGTKDEDTATSARKAEARRELMQQAEGEVIDPPRGIFARLFKKKPRNDDAQSSGFLSGLLGRSNEADDASDVAIEAVADSVSAEASDEADYALETANDDAAAGLFSRFRNARKAKKPHADADEDELVAAFDADCAPLENPLDIAREEDGADEAWEQTLDSSRQKSPLVSSIIGVGAIGILVGFGFFAYRYFQSL